MAANSQTISHDELEKLAKGWYTELRGKTEGNTRDWTGLTEDERINIMDAVLEVLFYMEKSWAWPK